MATGFTERWKGKVLAQLLGLGSGGMTLYPVSGTPNISPADFATLFGKGGAAGTTATSPIPNSGLTAFSTADGTSVLATPVANRTKYLQFDGASTGGARRIYSGSTLITFDGTNDVITSTAAGMITLLCLSTTRWGILGNTGAASLGTST